MQVSGAHPPSELSKEDPAGAMKTAVEQPTDAASQKGSAVGSECQQADQLPYPHLTRLLYLPLSPSSFAAATEELPPFAVDEASQLETFLGTCLDTSSPCWTPQILLFWELSSWTWPCLHSERPTYARLTDF